MIWVGTGDMIRYFDKGQLRAEYRAYGAGSRMNVHMSGECPSLHDKIGADFRSAPVFVQSPTIQATCLKTFVECISKQLFTFRTSRIRGETLSKIPSQTKRDCLGGTVADFSYSVTPRRLKESQVFGKRLNSWLLILAGEPK